MSELPIDTKSCPFCRAEVPWGASRCRFCAGDFAPPVDAPDLAGFWIGGIVLALVGLGVVSGSNGGGGQAFLGFVLLGIGGVVLQIATIAWGVSIGMRNRDEKTYVKRHTNARVLER